METDVLDEGGRLPAGLKAPPGPKRTLAPLPTRSRAEEISRLPGRLCLCQSNKASWQTWLSCTHWTPSLPVHDGGPCPLLLPRRVFSGSPRQRWPDLANKNRGLQATLEFQIFQKPLIIQYKYILCTVWFILILKIICCLSEIQISLQPCIPWALPDARPWQL